MTDLAYGQKWCDALSNDTSAYADLYAEDQLFAIDKTMMDDHMSDTVTFRSEIEAHFGGFANKDADNGVGIHKFTATKVTAGNGHALIEWDYEVSSIPAFRGIDNPDGKTLTANGSTFLEFDAGGKITHESTCMNDCPIFEQLGVPIGRPHYWDENFDPSALG